MTRADQWNRDAAIEQMAAAFLDANFYTMFDGKAAVQRYSDKYHQFGGVDVSINTTNFDEKCKCYGCLNQVLQYPGFECSLVNKAGRVQDGWFLNDQLSTDFYAVICLSASVAEPSQLTASSQISAADVLWVKKDDIKAFVEENTPIATIKQDTANLRAEGDGIEAGAEPYASMPRCLGYVKSRDGKYRKRYAHRKFWLTYSTRMDEKPVNLVMARETLENLPHSKHFIVKNGKTALI